MSEVTRILSAIEQGDLQATEQLLLLVYDELRELAAHKMAHESPGQTLNATALVHEAYLRLVGEQKFANRRHFFAAAAEAMRRILVERARRKARLKYGGGKGRQELHANLAMTEPDEYISEDILALDSALVRLAERHPLKARLVELRFFAGLTGDEAAHVLDISPSTADRDWIFARAYLRREIEAAQADKLREGE